MARRGYKEWAKHLRPKGKRAAAKQERQRARKSTERGTDSASAYDLCVGRRTPNAF